MAKKKVNHVIKVDNMIVKPLSPAKYKERMKIKLSKLNKGTK